MSSLTIRQQSNHSGWPKAAELIEIEGAHSLEASDRALMNTLLQHAHDSGRLTEPDAEWEISFAHLRQCQSRHESNDRVRESVRRIRRIEVRITYATETGERRELESSLLTFTDTSLDDIANATVQFGIPARLRMILARSNRWGRIRCEIGYAMTSKYAIALYEMICLRSNLDHCLETIDMQRFRDLLGVPPNTYDRADNFMRNVVLPATCEVNGLSDTGVRIDLVRKHPRATAHAVTMCWWRKSPEAFQAATRERNRSKDARWTGFRETAA
jgi:Initiator Replication protein